MINKLKKVKIKDILGIFIFIIVLIPSLVYKTYLKITKKEVWLICELKDMCRDNGYHFFKYMSEEHPEIKTFYAINKKCPDYNKIIKYDSKIIQWESLKHYFYTCLQLKIFLHIKKEILIKHYLQFFIYI